VEQAVETTAEEGWCPSCGAAARLHDRRPSWIRDLPAAGRPVTLVWVKRVWRCRESLCAKVTWTETHPAIKARASVTQRARIEACRRVGEDGHTVAAVAADFGVGWATIMGCVREHGRPLVDDPARLDNVHTLGVDETAFLAATATRHTVYATGIVALNGRARLLDVVEGRSGSVLSGWVSARDQAWRDGIGVAALDPFRGYATALHTTLPDAVRVLDAFHVVKLGFDAVDAVRRRVQQETTGHRGRKHDPLFGIRRLLRRGVDRHSERSWPRMLAGLDAGDDDQQIGRTWIAAQELRLLYRETTRAGAERRLLAWFTQVAEHEIPELVRLARTLDAWRPELFAYFDTGGVSNGPTEATNALIKKVKRVGHGFRNFDNYRLRLLLHCGVTWQTQPTTPIRGRLPRSAA
jgi:transposase